MTDDELAQKRETATGALRRAVELHAEAFHLDDDNDLLSEFIVVASWVNDETGGIGYTIQQSASVQGMAEHVGIGLLTRGLWMAQRMANDGGD